MNKPYAVEVATNIYYKITSWSRHEIPSQSVAQQNIHNIYKL